MFDYLYEARAWSITAENAEMRESLLKQELLATQITAENLRVVTPEMRSAAVSAGSEYKESTGEHFLDTVYLAMLEAA